MRGISSGILVSPRFLDSAAVPTAGTADAMAAARAAPVVRKARRVVSSAGARADSSECSVEVHDIGFSCHVATEFMVSCLRRLHELSRYREADLRITCRFGARPGRGLEVPAQAVAGGIFQRATNDERVTAG